MNQILSLIVALIRTIILLLLHYCIKKKRKYNANIITRPLHKYYHLILAVPNLINSIPIPFISTLILLQAPYTQVNQFMDFPRQHTVSASTQPNGHSIIVVYRYTEHYAAKQLVSRKHRLRTSYYEYCVTDKPWSRPRLIYYTVAVFMDRESFAIITRIRIRREIPSDS